MRILLGLLGVVVLVMLGVMNDDEPRRCPSCGLSSLYSRYVGHGKPLRWSCDRCGHVTT